MIFEWDDTKAESNKKKHGIGFAEAATTFADPNAIRRAVKEEVYQYFRRVKK